MPATAAAASAPGRRSGHSTMTTAARKQAQARAAQRGRRQRPRMNLKNFTEGHFPAGSAGEQGGFSVEGRVGIW